MNHRPACELINFPFRSLTFAITISETKARVFAINRTVIRAAARQARETYDGRFR